MVSSVGNTSSTANTVSGNAASKLASDFDTFLKLLTTQLKNQDPTSPMDPNEFTQQLVQFSQVEQQINMNKNLEKMLELIASQQSSNLVSYIGKEIDISTDKASLSVNQPAIWYYNLPKEASAGELRVIDKNGKTVHVAQMETGKGEHVFVWDGTVSGGAKMLPGDYKLEVVAKDTSGGEMDATIKTRGIVESIERIDGVDYLIVNGKQYAASEVLALRAPTTITNPQDNGSYVNYIGKDVEFYGSNSVVQDGAVRWSYGLAANASTTTIKVYDSNNKLVYQTTGDTSKGRHTFNWDGTKTDGTKANEDEIYKLVVESKSVDNQTVGVDVLGRGKVESVAFENLQAMFSIGGLGVPPSWIVAVH
jgi:flagellar basal-body rod modification protein FlgD